MRRGITHGQLLAALLRPTTRAGKALASRPVAATLTRLEPISKSFEEDDEAGKLDKAEEILGVVLPANEDPALPLNPGEEALDEPASHVAA
jgi:hypothetical protein